MDAATGRLSLLAPDRDDAQDDSAAYRRSSPIYFAEGLEDPLQ
jgi:hypothetical protein